jgi:hypothetical protein
MIAPAVAAMFFGRLRRSHDFAVLVAVNLALTAALVFHASSEARTSFQEGKRTPPILGPLALPPPWHAQIARIHWVNPPPASLGPVPGCGLYLGTADRVSVIYNRQQRRTLRVPDSRLVITILPGADTC